MANGIGYDYEESTTSYYHIYAVDGPLDGCFDAIGIEVPKTPENDADIQLIVEALERIAARAPNN